MLKAAYEAIQPNTDSSFSVRTFEEAAFTAPYHYHPEYELTLIVRGSGQRFVGSHVADYGPGDLVLVGADVPHCWKSAPGQPGQTSAVSVVAQFTADFLGATFFGVPELAAVTQLLQRSAGGVRFSDQKSLSESLLRLGTEADPFQRLLALLALLQQLASAPGCEVLSPQPLTGTLPSAERARFHRVMAYLVEHFRAGVTLAGAAEAASLTPTAFCKYFKTLTRKTFIETVIEYRLQYATRQLAGTDKPVADICYDSGFGDVSYFNKTFKKHLHRSPLQYRQAFG